MKKLSHDSDAVVTCKARGLRGVVVGSKWRVVAAVPLHGRGDKLLWHDFRLEAVKDGRRLLVSERLLCLYFAGGARLAHDRRWARFFTLNPRPRLRRVRGAVGCAVWTAETPTGRARA